MLYADIIDFDDSPTPFTDDYDFPWGAVAEGYRGFSWSTNWNGSFKLPNFSAAVYQNTSTPSLESGFQTAIPQGTKALFTPADFDQGYCFLRMSRSELCNIDSLSVAAAWRNGVTVELLGLRGSETVFSSFTTLGANGVMNRLFVNATGVDTLFIIRYGGVPAYPASDNSMLIVDNIGYSIPAPGACGTCDCGRRATMPAVILTRAFARVSWTGHAQVGHEVPGGTPPPKPPPLRDFKVQFHPSNPHIDSSFDRARLVLLTNRAEPDLRRSCDERQVDGGIGRAMLRNRRPACVRTEQLAGHRLLGTPR